MSKPKQLMSLADWCKLTDYPYSALAKEVPCSQPYIGMIAKGKAHPSFKMALRLEKLTNGMVSRENWYPNNEDELIGTPNESEGLE